MKIHRRKAISNFIGIGLMMILTGCAANDKNSNVYHGFALEVDDSAGDISNIRYTYGNELPDETIGAAKPVGRYGTHIAAMQIPEEFKITWETKDGQKHEARVAVRSRLTSDIKSKKILFLIMRDRIEGYVETNTPYGPKQEKFY